MDDVSGVPIAEEDAVLVAKNFVNRLRNGIYAADVWALDLAIEALKKSTSEIPKNTMLEFYDFCIKNGYEGSMAVFVEQGAISVTLRKENFRVSRLIDNDEIQNATAEVDIFKYTFEELKYMMEARKRNDETRKRSANFKG